MTFQILGEIIFSVFNVSGTSWLQAKASLSVSFFVLFLDPNVQQRTDKLMKAVCNWL